MPGPDPSAPSALDPVELLTAEAKSTLAFFQVPEALQPYLGQAAIRDVSNPEVRVSLQQGLKDDVFLDYDPNASVSAEVQALREQSVAELVAFATEQAKLLSAMAQHPTAWFVLRSRLIQLSQQIDAQMGSAAG